MQQTTQNTIQYHFASGAGLYKESLPTIWHYLSTTTKQKRPILFLEVHGQDAPHLLELQATLLKWKRVATKNQIPTFFFTILREPMPYAMSYFNFFHVQRPKKTSNKDFPQVAPAEANLLDVRDSIQSSMPIFGSRRTFLASVRQTTTVPGRMSARSEDISGDYELGGHHHRRNECQNLGIFKANAQQG
jgi:hypothetical protein